jgi:putative RecB family exonuclease
LRAKSYYSFGNTLHRVLERFHDSGDVGVETTGQLLSAFEESWIDSGFRSAEEMSEAYSEGLAILERHVEDHQVQARESKTLFVEKQLRHDMGDFVLLGRLDRVDEYPDGTLEIIDYKSGRQSVCERDVEEDIAMNVYQILLKKKYPDREVRARIWALRSGESATHAFTAQQLDEFEAVVLQIGRQIVLEDFHERRPVDRPLCASCDFLPLCQKDPVFS